MGEKGDVLMQKYEFVELLGQGNFAKVYRARDVTNGASVAIKVIDKETVLKNIGMIDQIQREIRAMSLMRHPNMVHLHEVLATKSKIYIVMEYVGGGELFDKLSKGRLNANAARNFFQQLIEAVDFCHSRGVCHRDIKLENLLLDENGNLKVSDFGLSALAESKRQDGLLHTTCGTPAYVAPEVLSRRGYDGAKIDIWSCGVVLFVLLSGYLPFQDANLARMYMKICRGQFKCPSWVSPDARRLISKMLDPDPKTRISISKIMENSWFRRGFQTKAVKEKVVDVDGDAKGELGKPVVNLNAFQIISLSTGLDLSGLFEDGDRKKEVKFMSNQPVKTIISKLEDFARNLKMRVMRDGGFLKFEGSKAGRKGLLSIDADILEVAPDFHLVHMRKSNGDTLEHHKVMKEVRSSLKDIVWTWEGEEEPRSWQQVEEPELKPARVPEEPELKPAGVPEMVVQSA